MIALGNVVTYQGLTWTITGKTAANYTLTPIYSDQGTVKVPVETPLTKLAASPAQWAMQVISDAS